MSAVVFPPLPKNTQHISGVQHVSTRKPSRCMGHRKCNLGDFFMPVEWHQNLISSRSRCRLACLSVDCELGIAFEFNSEGCPGQFWWLRCLRADCSGQLLQLQFCRADCPGQVEYLLVRGWAPCSGQVEYLRFAIWARCPGQVRHLLSAFRARCLGQADLPSTLWALCPGAGYKPASDS